MIAEINRYAARVDDLNNLVEPLRERDRKSAAALVEASTVLSDAIGCPMTNVDIDPQTGVYEMCDFIVTCVKRFSEHLRLLSIASSHNEEKVVMAQRAVRCWRGLNAQLQSDYKRAVRDLRLVRKSPHCTDDMATQDDAALVDTQIPSAESQSSAEQSQSAAGETDTSPALTEENDDLSVSHLKSQLVKHKELVRTLENRIIGLETQLVVIDANRGDDYIKEMEEKVDDQMKELSAYKHDVMERDISIEQLQRQLADTQSSDGPNYQEIDRQKIEIERLQAEPIGKVDESTQISAQVEQVNQLKEELLSQKNELESERSITDQIKSENDSLRGQLSDLNHEIETLKSDLSVKVAELGSLVLLNEQAESKSFAVINQNAELNTMLSEVRENTIPIATFDEQKEKLAELVTANKTLQSVVDEFKLSSQSDENSRLELSSRTRELEEKVSSLSLMKGNVETELEQTKVNYQMIQTKYDAASEETAKLADECKKLQDTVAEELARNEQLSAEVSRLTEHCEELNRFLNASKKTNEAYTVSIGEYQHQVELLTNQVADLNRENSVLVASKDELTGDLERARNGLEIGQSTASPRVCTLKVLA